MISSLTSTTTSHDQSLAIPEGIASLGALAKGAISRLKGRHLTVTFERLRNRLLARHVISPRRDLASQGPPFDGYF